MDISVHVKAEIHVHLHGAGLDHKLDEIIDLLEEEKIAMAAVTQEVKDMLAAIDAETTLAAGRWQIILDRLASDTVTPAERAELKAAGDAEIARLKTLGADPNVPVPPPPPALQALRQKIK